jgi:NTP pyrophosphatase (non-canonical NTP hydrolase)
MSFWTKTPDGNTVHINGNPGMSEETRLALATVMDAAAKQYAAQQDEGSEHMTMTKLIAEEQRDAALADNTRLRAENQRLTRVISSIDDPKALTLNAYQERANTTSRNTQIADDGLLYPVLGLVSEAGELAGKVKKIYRDKDGHMSMSDMDALIDEAADCLWYIAEIATQLGYELGGVARMNLEKLASRADRGVIGGSGDER